MAVQAIKAARLVGRPGCGMALALGVAFATVPVAAQDYNRGYSVEEYAKLAVRQPGKFGSWNIENYLHGMTAGLRAAKAEYDKVGAAPLYCVPDDALDKYEKDLIFEDPAKHDPSTRKRDLYDFLAEELAANGDAWRRDSTATIGTLALSVVRRKFPC